MAGEAKGKSNLIVGAAVAVVLAVAVVAYVLMQAGAGGSASGELRALVHDSDGVTHEISLSHDSETTVTTSLGTNVVVVEGGAVFVREADCSNQDCVHQGKVNAPGRQIICLPHKLWIEVVAEDGEGGQMDVDAVAGEGGAGQGEGFDALTR